MTPAMASVVTSAAGQGRSLGGFQIGRYRGMRRLQLAGIVFGRLTALTVEYRRDGTYWRCICACGSIVDVYTGSLTRGATRSCGCWRSEKATHDSTTHGNTSHPLFDIWRAMKYRCQNKKSKQWKDYGGRGVQVCPRWMVFGNFIADMGPRGNGMTLDRKDNDGNYEPSNCKWSTRKEQTANRRVAGFYCG